MKLLIFFVLIISACKKSGTANCFSVKIVTGICADMVVQIQDPAYFSYGQNGWVNPNDNQRYDHVFLIQNYCTNANALDASMRNGGAPFKVKFTANESTGNCIVCLAILTNRPTVTLAVKPCE